MALALVLTLAGCGAADTPSTPTSAPQPIAEDTVAPAPSPAPEPTSTPTATSVPTATPAPTSTPTATATATLTPTVAPTPTLAEAVAVGVQTANLRGGPGTAYSVAGQIAAGDRFVITGKNTDGSWWQIEQAGGSSAWVLATLVQTEGPIDAVAIAENIPTPPQAAPSGFGYGVSATSSQPGQIIGATRGLGFNWVKARAFWRAMEPSQEVYDWSLLDPLVDAARGTGVSIMAQVSDAPQWARDPGADLRFAGPPQDPATLAAFAGALAARYCGSPLRAVEIWNEPNIHYSWSNQPPDPAAYMRLLQAAYQGIKQACPAMIVVSGAPTPTGAPLPFAIDDVEYLTALYANGLASYSDVVGVKLPGYNLSPDEPAAGAPHRALSFLGTLQAYRDLRAQNGGGTLWVTVFGWAVGPATDRGYEFANDNTLEEQAAWTVQAYELLRAAGYVGAAFLWNLDGAISNPNGSASMWSAVDASWNPRPVYTALQQMAK
jgi:uncharacterized protein YraI